MGRQITSERSHRPAGFWNGLEAMLRGISRFFGNRVPAADGLTAIERDADHIRRDSRHWLM